MASIRRYLGGIDLPLGTIKQVPTSPFTPTPQVIQDNGTWIQPGAVYLQNTYPELYGTLGLINAASFTPRTSNTASQINAVTYGNGTYVYGGVGGAMGTSTDATTWTAQTSASYVIQSLAYGSNVFVRAGATGYTGYSTDGTTWTNYSFTDRTTSQINTVISGNTNVMAGALVLRTSTNLRNWTTPTYPLSSSITFNGSSVNPTANAAADLQEISYYIPGIYLWTVPADVTSVSAVAVGGGGGGVNSTSGGAGGNGADLRYSSGITVTPGETYTIQVGNSGPVGTTTGGDGGATQLWKGVPTGYSVYFNGQGDYLTAPANAAWAFGTGDFTVEFWAYTTGTNPYRISDRAPAGSAAGTWGFNITPTASNISLGLTEVITGEPGIKANTAASALNSWNHYAVSRSGGNVMLFYNGNIIGSGTFTNNFNTTSYPLSIGTTSGDTRETQFNGFMSNMRIVKGTAVYTANFVPSTSSLTAVANTVLLTCQSNTFIDNSNNNFTITTVGNPYITVFSPFDNLSSNLSLVLSAAGGGGGTTAATVPRSQNGNSSTIAGNIGGGSGGVRANNTTNTSTAGGGGAGGYSGNGGNPGVDAVAGLSGSGGGGGGGGGAGSTGTGGAGGGVSLMGERASGAGGAATAAGSPGSVGAAVYVGAGGAGADNTTGATAGQSGGVRIIWGAGRSYPSTNTAPLYNAGYSVVGTSGYITNSLDANTWLVSDTKTTTAFGAVAYGNGTWIAGGTGGLITYSNNGGSQWNTLPAADYYTNAINTNVYGGNLYIFAGVNILKTSTNLRTWSTPDAYGIASATINGSAYNGNTSGNTSPAQQVEFYTPGYYSWTVPAGVGSISAVTVGGGGGGVQNTSGGAGGNGADLRYSSNIAVTAGEILTIVTGAGGDLGTTTGIDGSASQIWRGTSTGNSVYLDGNDYYTVLDAAALQMTTGNYTMEGWWYPTTVIGYQTLFDKGGQGIGGILIQTGNGNSNIQVYSSNVANTVANITANLSVTTNAWNHIAVVRDGTTVTLYQNGNSVGSATMAANCNSTATFSMGAISTGANAASGYISNFRVVKGNAIYTSNFVPPTTQLTAVANTSLLTFQNANIQDNSTNNFFISAQGNVRTTTLSPFGNLTLLLSAAGGGGGTIAATAARPQNGFSSIITGNIGGGNGGIRTANTTTANSSGGGGAGGYSGAGGIPGVGLAGANGAGGGGGGGGGSITTTASGAGGGVSLMGERANGTGGAVNTAGSPGSLGAAVYVGGGGAGADNTTGATAGQSGGVRIIWGAVRSYPSTNTAPVYESKYVVSGTSGYIYASADGNSWIVADTKTVSTINAVTYGNGTYVFGGTGGMIATSTNGANWTIGTSGNTSAIQAVTYGANTYVYAGAAGALASSTDAITWTARTSGTTNSIFGLAYGANTYVYVGAGGISANVRSSTDAVTWTARTSNSVVTIRSVTYGNGLFVYVGFNGVVGTSTDGTTWISRTSGTSSSLYTVTYGNNLFVASGATGTETHRYSTDGVTWFSYTSGTTSSIRAMTYGNNLYLYGGDVGLLGTSTDGQAWVIKSIGTNSTIYSLTYGNGLYVYGGAGYVSTSTDSTTWTNRSIGTTSTVYGLTYGNGLYVGGTGGGYAVTSTDGITWASKYLDVGFATNSFYSVSYGNGLFFLGGSGGSEFNRYSTNGATWFSYTMGTTSTIYSLTYGNGLFVAGGGTGVLRSSTNGERWDILTSPFSGLIYSTTYGSNLYVAVASSGQLATSTDGSVWNLGTSGAGSASIYSVMYGNGLYLFAGASGLISTSTDATTWTTRTSGTSSSIYSLTYGNSVYMYAGVGGVLRTSTDAVTWDDRKSGNTNTIFTSVTPESGNSVFAGGTGWLGTTPNLALNQYSTAYNAATEFYVPAVTPTSFGTLQANVSYLVGATQTIYVKARQ